MFLAYLDVFAKVEVFRLDDNRHDRKVVHDDPVAAWSFTGDLGFGGDNLRRLVSGRFDFRLYLSQVAVIKREHGVPVVYRIAFLTHLPEHFPFQPCKGSVQFNYRGTELLYGLGLGLDDLTLLPVCLHQQGKLFQHGVRHPLRHIFFRCHSISCLIV